MHQLRLAVRDENTLREIWQVLNEAEDPSDFEDDEPMSYPGSGSGSPRRSFYAMPPYVQEEPWIDYMEYYPPPAYPPVYYPAPQVPSGFSVPRVHPFPPIPAPVSRVQGRPCRRRRSKEHLPKRLPQRLPPLVLERPKALEPLEPLEQLPSQTLRAADIHRLPDSTCGICLETFKSGNVVLRLPCLHIYHRKCITPWLRSHSTCPQDQMSIHS